jgi:hypothetical protein
MKNQLDKDIEKIKLARMKPEEKFLHETFSNLKQYEENNIIYYKNKHHIVCCYDKIYNTVTYDYSIYSELYKKYKMRDKDIYILVDDRKNNTL